MPRTATGLLSLVSCISCIATLVVLSGVGCQSNDQPAAPLHCASGFRNQCTTDLSVGAGFACALLEERTVWCWGRNDQGQLGYGTTDLCPVDVGGGQTRSIACHTFPFRVVGLDGAVAIASGGAFSCAVLADGSARCWGDDSVGELGNGSTLTSQTPVAVSSLSGLSSIAAGNRHACAVTNDGKVACWGANDQGQLGSKTTTTCTVGASNVACSKTPVVVAGLDGVAEVSAGASHTCARTKDGHVTCWGDNHWGQLGVGKPDPIAPDVHRPVLASLDEALGPVLSISAGAFHTCAVRDGGSVFCWGRGDHRELGAPPPGSGAVGCSDPCSTLAVEVADLPSTKPVEDAGVDAGADATFDGSTDGSAKDAAPDTAPDAIADATTDGKSDAAKDAIVETSIDADFDAGPSLGAFGRTLGCGDGFGCVRIDDGTVRCWGVDSVGQLGDGRTTSDPSGPTLVIASPGAAATNPLQGVVRVRAGETSACAIMSDESVRCWGSNQSGALGVGHFTPQQGPVPVNW